jgi:dTDP-glucose 4,6-dehydratase
MRVLLTGASGFIGSNVLEYMLDKTDWEFTCLCSFRHYGNPLNLKPNKRVKVITCDISNPIPDLGQFDYILNLASESHVDRSINNPVPFIENNIKLMIQMLEYARKHPPKVFLQFSTDEVYGAMAHNDWDILLPSNPYAASKASQEMICIAYWKTYKVPIVITNSNNIVGKNQNPEKFVPKIAKMIKMGDIVEIHTLNGKAGKRYWNAVQNVADALLFILKQEPVTYCKDIDRPKRYSLSGGTELDNLEMAELVALILNKPLTYKTLDAETIRPGYDEFYDNAESELDRLGWKPVISLDDCLEGFLHD